jgi:hypothetical protein
VDVTLLGGFWLQYGSRQATEVVTLADELQGAMAGRPGVVFTPVNVPGTLRPLYQHARARGDAVLDPGGFLLDRDPTKRAEEHFPWLVQNPRPTNQAEWEAWIQQGLDHQLSPDLRGGEDLPSFLVTPCPQLVAAQGAAGLYPVLDAASSVQAAATSECWLGVNIDRDYLREEPHLVRLANALVSADTPGIVLRCFQNQMPPVTDQALLEGLREVVEACAMNDIHVFLPNSGWLGWLAMAWGAWGFSGGIAKGSWYDRMPTPMTNVPKYESIFEAQLYRYVRWPVHQALAQEPGYQPCWCDSCSAMAGSYDGHEAARHQIRLAHEEGATLRALSLPDRRTAVRQRLDAGIQFRDSLPLVLRARAQAEFLDRWRRYV